MMVIMMIIMIVTITMIIITRAGRGRRHLPGAARGAGPPRGRKGSIYTDTCTYTYTQLRTESSYGHPVPESINQAFGLFCYVFVGFLGLWW